VRELLAFEVFDEDSRNGTHLKNIKKTVVGVKFI
jgi:hypothetical protein